MTTNRKIESRWVLDSEAAHLDLIILGWYCAQRKFRNGRLWVLMSHEL